MQKEPRNEWLKRSNKSASSSAISGEERLAKVEEMLASMQTRLQGSNKHGEVETVKQGEQKHSKQELDF